MDANERREYERRQEEQLLNNDDGLDEQKLFGETPEAFAKRKLDELLVDAVEELWRLCRFDEDSKVRFAVAKYIIDRNFGSTSPTSGRYVEQQEDALMAFMEKVVKDA